MTATVDTNTRAAQGRVVQVIGAIVDDVIVATGPEGSVVDETIDVLDADGSLVLEDEIVSVFDADANLVGREETVVVALES